MGAHCRGSGRLAEKFVCLYAQDPGCTFFLEGVGSSVRGGSKTHGIHWTSLDRNQLTPPVVTGL